MFTFASFGYNWPSQAIIALFVLPSVWRHTHTRYSKAPKCCSQVLYQFREKIPLQEPVRNTMRTPFTLSPCCTNRYLLLTTFSMCMLLSTGVCGQNDMHTTWYRTKGKTSMFRTNFDNWGPGTTGDFRNSCSRLMKNVFPKELGYCIGVLIKRWAASRN